MSHSMDYRRDNHKNNRALYNKLQSMPKIELHRHLEGSLRLGTMAEIAREYKLELPGYDVEDFRHLVQVMPDDSRTSQGFLSKFQTLRQFYRSPEVIDRVTYEVIADAVAENICYLELRFAPMALASESGYTLNEVIDWVIKAVDRAKQDFNIPVGLIMGMNRHEPPAVGEWGVDIAIERKEDGIVAVDLMGDEERYGGKPFQHVFEKARDAGLAITIHAGEWSGPDSAVEAVEVLGATRLGHGVRLPEDPEKFKAVCERGVFFEVCVTSNVQSGVAKTVSSHPLREMYAAYPDLMTINSDDPSVSALNLTDELVTAVEALEMSVEDVQRQMLNAARAAFLPEDEKAALVKRLRTAYQLPTRPKVEGAAR